MRVVLALFAVLVATGHSPHAAAAETITYTYDARGRLIQAERVGGRNGDVLVTATFDDADNRIQYIVTGRSKRIVVVVPLNGFTVIPLP